MCGIFGTLNTSGLTTKDSDTFLKFFDIQKHRGPDGSGDFIGENVALGMVRLSIIDTAHGWQPLWNEKGTIGVVANGEIYNHIELRDELVKRNHLFSTHSDVETIVHLYEEYGLDFVSHLRGMFAFALVDLENNLLVLGRDRLGEKPLYVSGRGGNITFSSELRTLIQTGITPLDFDSSVLSSYFQYGFIPEPYTLIKGVRKVEAGTLEIYSLDSTDFRVQNYWNLDSIDVQPSSDPASELREIMDVISRLVMRSDVPVGVALSSGIDSSILAAISSNSGQETHSFTVGYVGSPSSDESADATALAHSFGITPHVVLLDSKEVAEKFGELCILRDEPIADIAGAGYFAVAELAHSFGIKVLLSGQGADELFWGYRWIRDVTIRGNRRAALLAGQRNYLEYLQISPRPITRGELLDWLVTCAGFIENIRELFEDLKDRRRGNHEVLVYERGPRARAVRRTLKRLIKSDAQRTLYKQENRKVELDISSFVQKTLIETYLKSNGLGQMDRLFMASSVEARSPFVDYQLVEFAVQQIAQDNRFDLPLKFLLLEAVGDLVPDKIKTGRKKGFTPPTKEWYREIYAAQRANFINPRIVELGLVDKKAIGVLNRPINMIGRPSVLWLELAVLEMWVRGLEDSSPSINN